MRQIFLVLIIFLLFGLKSLSSESIDIPTNKEIFSSFLNEFIDTLTKSTTYKNFLLRIQAHPISDFIENDIVGNLSPIGYKFFLSNCDTCTVVQIGINKFETSYKRIKREKPTNLVIRKIELELVCLLKPPKSTIDALNFKKSYTDTLTTENLDWIERDGYPFTGERPKEPENFLKKYFEPIIIIGSSALAIILFFTVRSK